MKKLTALALLASAVLPGAASAATFTYTYTGVIGTDSDFSFSIDDTAPAGGRGGGLSFDQVALTTLTQIQLTTITFFALADDGGLLAGDRLIGPQLYTGDQDGFTLLTGTFPLVDQTLDGLSGTLVVTSNAPAGVPEPAIWGLMLAGFGLVGAGLRQRRRSTTVTYA